MGRRIAVCAALTVALGTAQVAVAGQNPKDARIAGRVLVCTGPGHCLQRRFRVRAVNAGGQTVATYTTTNAQNSYALSVPPGSYKLVAKSSGLNCKSSATAVAHKTTHANITCPVP